MLSHALSVPERDPQGGGELRCPAGDRRRDRWRHLESATAGSWARVHPGFTAVAPADMGGPVTLAYLMGPGDIALGRYVDQWLALKAASGFKAEQLDYWINGNPRPDPRQRWNLLDAVLQAWRGPLRADEVTE